MKEFGKQYKYIMEFIARVRNNGTPMIISTDYVVMSKKQYDIISNQVEKPVEPACRHKLTAKQFFIEQYQNGKCEDITTNPEPEFNNAFYLNIYKLMEDYSKSV